MHKQNSIEKWKRSCIYLFPKKNELEITKNYRGIPLSGIAAKVYNVHLSLIYDMWLRKLLGKISVVFVEINPQLLRF